MKIHISITDDNGNRFEGDTELARVAGKVPRSKAPVSTRSSSPKAELSFSLNSRAFMNKHAKSKSGSRKFTLLLAHMTKGSIGQEIAGKQLVAEWNRMKGVLGAAFMLRTSPQSMLG